MGDPGSRPPARQPFTLPGVARFAHAPFFRLFIIPAIVAVFSACIITFLVGSCWTPVIDEAVDNLPERGRIAGGQLIWPGRTVVQLAADRFLAISVNPQSDSGPRYLADLFIEFQSSQAMINSIAGFTPVAYPPGLNLPLNRPELAPLWGAWRESLIAAAGVLAVPALFFIWSVLACCYTPIIRAIGFYFDRDLTLAGSWKMAFAALMPGALLMCFALLLYSLGEINLVVLALLGVAHILLGLFYVLFAPFALPANAARSHDPFTSEPRASARKRKKQNPFDTD